MKKTQGHVKPRQQGGAIKGELYGYSAQLAAMVEQYSDATLLEYCEHWATTHNNWVSTSTMCRALQKQKLTVKKDVTQQPRKNRKSPKVD
ncbi:hypothetical protein [Nostoc sp.]|uniref:hypothetical protein n=1 Tax=Nostoc sp. TaxID=1180 RepID=UPI002FFD49A4